MFVIYCALLYGSCCVGVVVSLLCVLFCVVLYNLFIRWVFVAVCDCFDMCLCGLFVLYGVLLYVFVLLCLCDCLNVFVYVVCYVFCEGVRFGCC